ncbi:hypothetical protein MPSEU_000727900 [Mayamaea pseudoterrestris]|nr:hypothetical protein MPSEU_000727400 [Mayamaea pseudoterrestris]GKY97697.1 hypothetical protein MPSEU_000727900 [Mayamaea pseudoterrestris]
MEICGTDQSHGAMIDEDEDSKKGRDNGQEDEKPTDASIDSSLVASEAAAINCSSASSTTKRLRIPAKFRNKKPADMPRRPLSAYNIFFRDQRRQIMEDRHRGVVSQLNAATTSTGSGSGGLFESMARTIASKWKTIAKDELERYSQLANEDTLRYRAQMEEYNQKFVEDKSMAAKKRRAENRKMKQVEKAQTKALESKAASKGLTSQLREEETVHTAVPSTSPRNILQQNVTGKYPHTGSATTAHHSQFSNDNQMRLMLAHANGLSQTLPSIQNQNHLVQEYLRQIQTAQSPTILTQQQLSPARSRLAATGHQDGSMTSFYQVGTQNQWSILQLLHHQHVQQHSLPTTSTAHFGDLNQFFTMQQPYQQTRQLHVQPQLQLQQQQPQPQQQMPSQLDNTAVGLLLQQFQQQHFRLQQQQNMVHWNTNASFYQQQQQQQQQNQPQVQQEIIHREDSDNLDSSSTGRRQRKNSGSQD